ncbi:MAG: penicillin acylase family protein, partial [Rhodothermales bacterium]
MSSPVRLLLIFALFGCGLLAGGGLIWYLAYGVKAPPPERRILEGLDAPVEIGWGPELSIHARHLNDAIRALGYAHGRERAWSVILWRQAATGRLSEWFGGPTLELDRLARHLGLATLARTSFDALEAEDKALIEAYSEGLNVALMSPEGKLQQELVLLGLEPEPWQPWHTLA